jgi:signal transduction histidine kinase
MLSRLKIAQDSQRRFVADASHELRTPLTSIRGNAGLLLRDPAPPAGDAREAVVDIAAESERMSRLVDGLLTLARADAGQELQRSRLDLASVVEPVARRSGLASSLEPAPVCGDHDSLTQLAWILADNARRHGGGDAAMWVRRGPEGGARLIVGDHGPGIPPGEEERIFERFYQADAARSNGGTGLGLAIARWIVQQHGGRIWAGNAPGWGAVFVVEMPWLPSGR